MLTLSRNYFRLRKLLERRLYEIAHKHCGYKQRWVIGLTKLKDKCGSYSTDKEFKRLISKIIAEDVAHDHIPDYSLRLEGSQTVFYSRGSVPRPQEDVFEGRLDSDAYEAAHEAAPG